MSELDRDLQIKHSTQHWSGWMRHQQSFRQFLFCQRSVFYLAREDSKQDLKWRLDNGVFSVYCSVLTEAQQIENVWLVIAVLALSLIFLSSLSALISQERIINQLSINSVKIPVQLISRTVWRCQWFCKTDQCSISNIFSVPTFQTHLKPLTREWRG